MKNITIEFNNNINNLLLETNNIEDVIEQKTCNQILQVIKDSSTTNTNLIFEELFNLLVSKNIFNLSKIISIYNKDSKDKNKLILDYSNKEIRNLTDTILDTCRKELNNSLYKYIFSGVIPDSKTLLNKLEIENRVLSIATTNAKNNPTKENILKVKDIIDNVNSYINQIFLQVIE